MKLRTPGRPVHHDNQHPRINRHCPAVLRDLRPHEFRPDDNRPLGRQRPFQSESPQDSWQRIAKPLEPL